MPRKLPPDRKEKAIKNLKTVSWKKGQSGNPKGKPKGARDRATILRELLDLALRDGSGKLAPNPLNPDEKKITIEKAVDVALITRALKGNIEAIKEIKDTLHGKMKEVREIIPPDVTKKEVDDMSDEEAQAAYESALKG